MSKALSLTAHCEELGQILGLDKPVSEAVVKAAIENEAYANNLLICRRQPDMLQYLLDHPPEQKSGFSTLELLAKGTKALVKWGCAGFTTVDEDVYAKRLAACQRCPDLIQPLEKQQLLYRAVGVTLDERAVCRQCGCGVARKARLTTERCPSPHLEKTGHTRWDEPVADS